MKRTKTKKHVAIILPVLLSVLLLFSCSPDAHRKPDGNTGTTTAAFLSGLSGNVKGIQTTVYAKTMNGISSDFENGRLTIDLTRITDETGSILRGYIVSQGIYMAKDAVAVIAAYSLDGTAARSIAMENGTRDDLFFDRLIARIDEIARQVATNPTKADLVGTDPGSAIKGLFCISYFDDLGDGSVKIAGTAFDGKGNSLGMNDSLYWTGETAHSYSFFTRSADYSIRQSRLTAEADDLRKAVLEASRSFDEYRRNADEKLSHVFEANFRSEELQKGKAQGMRYFGTISQADMGSFASYKADGEVCLNVDFHALGNGNFYYTATIVDKKTSTPKAGIAGYSFEGRRAESTYNDFTGNTFNVENFTEAVLKDALKGTGKESVSYAYGERTFAAISDGRLFLESRNADRSSGFTFADGYSFCHANHDDIAIYSIPESSRATIRELTARITDN